MPARVISVDLGGTNIRAALCDEHGRIIKHETLATLAEQGPEAVFRRIVESIHTVAEGWHEVAGIGLGAPGPLDPWQGIIIQAPNLPGMDGFPMKARLEAEFGRPAVVGNDANLAALGEHRYGAGRGVENMVYMTISTGIGGGIIAEGQLQLGWRGFAGEVGHQTLEAHGPRCNCGNVGCLEVLASGPAIARDARQAILAGRDSSLNAERSMDVLTTADVAAAARAGDPLALELFDRAGYYIGLGVVNLLHILDTERFVFGGGVAIHAWDLLASRILATLDQYAMESMRPGVGIAAAKLGDDAGLAGAAALALGATTGQA